MALADQLARVQVETESLRRTFGTEISYMRGLESHPRNISDTQMLQALKCIHNVVSDLTGVVLSTAEALEEINRQSTDSFIRQAARGH